MIHSGVSSLTDMVASLLLWVASVSGYDMPSETPSVVFASSDSLQEMACGGRRCAVVAFYHIEERTVYLRDDMGRAMNVCAVSILVHELVHHMQHRNKHQERFGDYSERVRYAMREQEAHDIQSMYIRQFPYRYRPREQTISYAYDPQRFGLLARDDDDSPRYYMTRGCSIQVKS